jgi:hypothetical protein
MADKTIPQLDPVVTPAPTDRFGVRQAGDIEDKRETREQVHALEDGEFLLDSFTNNISAAAGGGQVGATGLTSAINFVTDVNDAGDGVRLPATFPVGAIIEVHVRSTSDSPDVYPAVGDDLGEGLNLPLRLAPNQQVRFIATVADTTWVRLFQELIQSEAANGAIIEPNIGGASNSPSLIPDKRDNDTGVAGNGVDTLFLIANNLNIGTFAGAGGQVKQTWRIDVTVTANPGGGQGSAVELLSTWQYVNVVATTGDSVRLPGTFQPGTLIWLKNTGANACDVFPASGDDLGQGLNTALSLDPGTSALFVGSVANSIWEQESPSHQSLLLGEAPGALEATPTLAFGDGNTGFFESADNVLEVTVNGTTRYVFQGDTFRGDQQTAPGLIQDRSTSEPSLLPRHDDTDTGIGWGGADQMRFFAGGVEALRFTELSSGAIQAPSASLAVTAFAGGGQGSATALTQSYNVITVVATAGDSVRLPDVFSLNSLIYIKNDDAAEAADVFPATGDDLGAGLNTAVSLLAGESLTFIATVLNSTWTPLIVAAGAALDPFAAVSLTLSETPGAHQAQPTLAFGDGDTGFFENSDDSLRMSAGGVRNFSMTATGIQFENGTQIQNEATSATNPVFIPRASDVDSGLGSSAADQLSLIAGGLEMLRLVETGVAATNQVRVNLTIGGAAATPALAFGDGDTGFWENIDDVLNIGVAGARVSVWTASQFAMDDGGGPAIVNAGGTAASPNLRPNKADIDSGLSATGADVLINVVGGVAGLFLREISSNVLQAPDAQLGLTAFATGGQGSATAIAASYAVFSTVATLADSGRLPDVFAVNTVVTVKNDGAADMDLFPASGDDLGAGTNIAVSIVSGEAAKFIATVADTTWTQLGTTVAL